MMMDLLVLLVIAGVALFVLSRLYAVLGKDVGAAPLPPKQKPAPQEEVGFVKEPVSRPSFAGLAALQKIDASFDEEEFLSGARSAYEIIVRSYASGDRDALRPLLEDEVYNSYDAAISEREKSEKSMQTDIVKVHDVKITEAEIDKNEVFVTVEFHTDLSIIEKNKDGDILEKEDTGLAETKEQWTFSRGLNSNDPNWRLVAVAAIA
ncbi:MAG: Tim44 domain-containing protein [Robiginitomaculum sp.]|nr:Tim44 domain-containing protein [Robiginitomaculum sp.]